LPVAGLTVSGGSISGTPTTATTTTTPATFTLTATDAEGSSASQQFTISINNTFTVLTPTLPIGTGPSGSVAGEPYSAQLNAVNGTTPVTWAQTGGILPNGMSVTGAGAVSGIPTQNGSFTFTVTATDAATPANTASATFTLLIEPLTIATATLPSGTVGAPYSASLTTANGTSPFTFTVAGGTLPAGVSLSTAGVLSGTPTASGTSNFTVQVTDNDGQLATQAYMVTIAPFAITTTSLPNGKVGVGYHETIVTTSDTFTPITYAVSNGALPAGLSLDTAKGLIQGVPTAIGTNTFTISATDSKANVATQSYTIVISQ
jgi:hypothetical protein